MTKEVKKIMILGRNKYFTFLEYTRSIIDFYEEIDMIESYWEIRKSIIGN
jgi:hypothetical protein